MHCLNFFFSLNGPYEISCCNAQVCGEPGDPCSALCGGAGCDRCGNTGCEGAVTIAQTANSLAQQAEDLLERKSNNVSQDLIPQVSVLKIKKKRLYYIHLKDTLFLVCSRERKNQPNVIYSRVLHYNMMQVRMVILNLEAHLKPHYLFYLNRRWKLLRRTG